MGGGALFFGEGGSKSLGKKPGVQIIGGSTKFSVFFRIFCLRRAKNLSKSLRRIGGRSTPPSPRKKYHYIFCRGNKITYSKISPFADKMRVSPPPRSPQINNARDVSNCACLIFNCITFKVNFVLFYK